MKLNRILLFIIFLKLFFSINSFIINSNSDNIYNSDILYNNNNKEDNNKIKYIDKNNNDIIENGYKIFIIPHSHCDGGWLKTFDEYYYGTVKFIISGIINELNNDIEKKFNWVEVGFFSKWYSLQNEDTRDIVKKLVKNKQLEFISGGWVQNDEATANLDDVIEQMTQGHMWLKDTFNVTVEYGWQIDPFGYSSLTPTLFSRMGMKGLVINRVSYNVKNYMKENREMEFYWKGSETLGQKSELLVSTMDIHYSYPEMLDPKNSHYSVQKRVEKFIKYLNQLSKTRNSKTILIQAGDDFRYWDAAKEFSVSKEWLSYIQERKEKYGISLIKYATLSEYFQQLNFDIKNQNIKLNQFNKDFFPYATASDEYWTGYYTTRPVLKRQIRDVSNLIRMSDTIFTLFNIQNNYSIISNQLYNDLNDNRNIISLAQHHDIVTGTSRSYVLYDYFLKLEKARLSSYNILSNVYSLLNQKMDSNNNRTNNKSHLVYQNIINLDELNSEEHYSIVFFNSLGWSIKQHTSIKIKSNDTSILSKLKILNSDLQDIKDIQIQSLSYKNRCFENDDIYLLFFIIDLPPIGYSTYYITLNSNNSNNYVLNGKEINLNSNNLIFKSKELEYEFSNSGNLKSIKIIKSNKTLTINQSFYKYKSKESGPYIFNAGILEKDFRNPTKYVLYEGPLVSQISMIYDMGDCGTISIINHRIYNNPNLNESLLLTEKFLETSYSFTGVMNTERIIKYKVKSCNNNNEFYTDNGLETRKRIYNDDGSTTSNYYPTLNYVDIKDHKNNHQFTVYVDRSVGVTSRDGEIEIMLHRTMQDDDWKGISWPSRDISRNDGKLYFNLDSIENQKLNEKRISLQIDHQPVFMIKKVSQLHNYTFNYIQNYSPLLSNDFPKNVHLQSLKTLSNNRIGIRFLKLNNQYNNKNFNNLKIDFDNLIETGLSFQVNNINNINSNHFKIDQKFPIKSGQSEYNHNNNQSDKNNINNNITDNINPLEIKSFIIKLNKNNNNNNIIIHNNNINNNSNIDKLNNTIYYQYDFSVLPLGLSHYNDIGQYSPEDHLTLIIIIAIVSISVIVLGFIIYKKRKYIFYSRDKREYIRLNPIDYSV